MSGEDGKAAAAAQRYAEDSSMGGVRSAARPGVFLKVVWVVVIIVCAVITVFSLHRLYLHHSRSRHSMTSYTNDAVAQDFPSVTLCNVNPVVSPDRPFEGDPPAARRRRAEDSMLTLSQFLQNYKIRKTYSRSEEDNRHLRHEYQTLVDQLSDQEREDAGHDLKLMLSRCQLGDVPCDYRNFTRFYHHTFGNCFTFVADPRHLRVTKTGPQHGLTVELDTQSQEYTIQDEPGFVIVAHGSRDTVFPAEEGVFVPEGNAAYIALTKAERTRVTNTNCNSEDSGRDGSNIYAVDTRWRYSQRGCQHGCLQREVFRQCGCCDVDLPCPASFLDPTRPHTTSTTTTTTTRPTTPNLVGGRLMSAMTAPASDPVQRCRPGHTEEMCLRDVIQAYANGDLPCQKECVPRCSVTTYSPRFSMSGLTSENQPNTIGPQEGAYGQTGGLGRSEGSLSAEKTSAEMYTPHSEADTTANTLTSQTPTTSTTTTTTSTTTTTTTTRPPTTAATLRENEEPKIETRPPMVTEGPSTMTTSATFTEGSGTGTTPPVFTEGSGTGTTGRIMFTEGPGLETRPPVVTEGPSTMTTPATFTEGSGTGTTPPVFTEGSGMETNPQPFIAEGTSSAGLRRRRQVPEGGFLDYLLASENGQVRVHVYFEDLRSDVSETVESSDWVQVMADIGGITSLWLGLSVLGVLEVMHLLVQLLLLGCGSLCGGGPRPTPVKPMAPASTFA